MADSTEPQIESAEEMVDYRVIDPYRFSYQDLAEVFIEVSFTDEEKNTLDIETLKRSLRAIFSQEMRKHKKKTDINLNSSLIDGHISISKDHLLVFIEILRNYFMNSQTGQGTNLEFLRTYFVLYSQEIYWTKIQAKAIERYNLQNPTEA